jgi:pimeloyl-ACP methyl ester carboxylesterase
VGWNRDQTPGVNQRLPLSSGHPPGSPPNRPAHRTIGSNSGRCRQHPSLPPGSFSHKVADTAQAARLRNASGRIVRLLVGHSFGGAAVIAAANLLESVRALSSIGAPYEPGHVEHNYDALVERILADGEAPFLIGGKAPQPPAFCSTIPRR